MKLRKVLHPVLMCGVKLAHILSRQKVNIIGDGNVRPHQKVAKLHFIHINLLIVMSFCGYVNEDNATSFYLGGGRNILCGYLIYFLRTLAHSAAHR